MRFWPNDRDLENSSSKVLLQRPDNYRKRLRSNEKYASLENIDKGGQSRQNCVCPNVLSNRALATLRAGKKTSSMFEFVCVLDVKLYVFCLTLSRLAKGVIDVVTGNVWSLKPAF